MVSTITDKAQEVSHDQTVRDGSHFPGGDASILNPGVSEAAAVETYQNLATGRCLDSNTSGSAYTLGCNGGSFQRWR
jgi:hypothetical protein